MPATPAFTPRTQPLLGPTDIGGVGEVIASDGLGGVYWAAAGGGGGVTDHGDLTGLGDDDHPQYPLSAGRAGGQTIVGGTGVSDSLILAASATSGFTAIVSPGGISIGGPLLAGSRMTVHQTAIRPIFATVGEGRNGGSDSVNGIFQSLRYNSTGLRQWEIGPTDSIGSATGRIFRLVFGSAGLSMDAVTGTNARAGMCFGHGLSNIAFGQDFDGPSDAKTFFASEATKKSAVIRAAVSQSANLLECQSSGGSRLSGIGPNGAILNAVFTDATRPAAGVAGRVIFNSTDSNLNIDTGTQWVTPDGTIT